MPNHKGTHLIENLEIDAGAAGVFGICYSILTWSGVGKGLGFSPGSWLKTLGKLVEDGHAITFLYVKNVEVVKKIKRGGKEREEVVLEDQLTTTGISDDGWVFDTGPVDKVDWARPTGSATTYVYYIGVNEAFIDKYRQLEAELKGTKTTYDAFWPNLPFVKTHYQNCVSHSHYLVSRLGLASWPNTVKGWWMPSASNWVDWFKSFAPTGRAGFGWKYRKFESTNTHIPDSPPETVPPPKPDSLVEPNLPVEPALPVNAVARPHRLAVASPLGRPRRGGNR
jgi:hypothetical protein